MKTGEPQGRDFFFKTIAEFADCLSPELNIVDARSILTVSGPSLKDGSVVKQIDRIVVSGDIVATDAYCAGILADNDKTFDKKSIAATLQYAEKLGLGVADLSRVKIVEINA